ncbi:hypothetical protein GCM10009808_18410 [Microbacterium sediminicola]|uniref:Adhesin domain-containing protein n=1 Tax=Microbacterium sediminicola TaxID=415210 RepID=A0ABP4UCP1_9MICO
MTTIQPPAPAAPAPTSVPPTPPTRGSSRVIAILLIVLGSFVILGTVFGTVLSTVRSGSVSTSASTLAVSGVQDLSVELRAGALTIEYADVREAELTVTSGRPGAWTFETRGTELVVASPVVDWGFPWVFAGPDRATLTLPESLEGIDAALGMSAGGMEIVGDFGDVVLRVGAGSIELAGSADAVELDLAAGKATIDLADVSQAVVGVSAGSADVDLTGTAPRDIQIAVSAGSANVSVPDVAYDVTSEVSAGDFRNSLGTDSGASRTIAVEISAGEVILRSN